MSMNDDKPSGTKPFTYVVDERRFIVSPSGAKLARISPEGIWLYDKRLRQEWLLSVEQLLIIMNATVEL